MSFKDRDETPEEKKKREYSENPKNFEAIRVLYCQKCGCHYKNGCTQHPMSDQNSIGKK